MENNQYQHTLNVILNNNRELKEASIRRVLVVYEEVEFFIGDTCILFDRFRLCRRFFGEQIPIDVSCLNKKYTALYESFSRNNPHVNSVNSLGYEDIDFTSYDVVVCIAYDEELLLKALHVRYGERFLADECRLAVFSFSGLLLIRGRNLNIKFPSYEKLFSFLQNVLEEPHELYLAPEEQEWADTWLKNQNLKEGERLLILLDSSSSREKLMKVEVHFEILRYLLKQENVKVLIFDEKNIGKEEFYKQWLSSRLMKKIIFSKGTQLRESIAILGSGYTKMVLGPCTGLVHCASAIFNNYVKNGMPVSNVPLIMTYTGKWDADSWWGNAPLVNCLLLLDHEGHAQLRTLSSLDPAVRADYHDRLTCNEYASEMIINYISERMQGSV
ncbi:glycosyltransferase family 9 protein [Chitinophaga solisilvae]|uniref:glycosyltransferase family 9 protein n=1 Tax=Chitinophaga solisilvae TaxID=1233460 RepID=UPI00136FAD31|nr:glycosyltransferase family 9 protein [Chitinophaga solisilvae]